VTSVSSNLCHASTCLRIGSKFRCMRSTPTAMQSMSENDFECLARTGVNTPETISPSSACCEVHGSTSSKSHSEDSRSRGDAMPRLTKRQDSRLQCETDTRELLPSKFSAGELVAGKLQPVQVSQRSHRDGFSLEEFLGEGLKIVRSDGFDLLDQFVEILEVVEVHFLAGQV
jgi:hypothetical protein